MRVGARVTNLVLGQHGEAVGGDEVDGEARAHLVSTWYVVSTW